MCDICQGLKVLSNHDPVTKEFIANVYEDDFGSPEGFQLVKDTVLNEFYIRSRTIRYGYNPNRDAGPLYEMDTEIHYCPFCGEKLNKEAL